MDNPIFSAQTLHTACRKVLGAWHISMKRICRHCSRVTVVHKSVWRNLHTWCFCRHYPSFDTARTRTGPTRKLHHLYDLRRGPLVSNFPYEIGFPATVAQPSLISTALQPSLFFQLTSRSSPNLWCDWYLAAPTSCRELSSVTSL